MKAKYLRKEERGKRRDAKRRLCLQKPCSRPKAVLKSISMLVLKGTSVPVLKAAEQPC